MQRNKLIRLLNQRVSVSLKDSSVIYGQLIAFDKSLNIVLADSVNLLQGGESRILGLVIIRGENLVSIVPHNIQVSDNPARVPASMINTKSF
jgi:small nuclear ribonucleoprotein (snRNP)-like protein